MPDLLKWRMAWRSHLGLWTSPGQLSLWPFLTLSAGLFWSWNITHLCSYIWSDWSFNSGRIGNVGASTLRVWLGLLELLGPWFLVPSSPSASWSPWGEGLLPPVSHSYNDFSKCIRPRAMGRIMWNHTIKETIHSVFLFYLFVYLLKRKVKGNKNTSW